MKQLSNTIHWYSSRSIELVSFILLGLDNVNPEGRIKLTEKLNDFVFINEVRS